MKKNIFGFTLVELLVGLILISLGLISIIGLMRSAVSYTDKTRQEVLAINLAREGIESVYTIRNTNWLRRSGIKDQNRLCVDSDIDSTEGACSTRISSSMHWGLGHKRYASGEVLPFLIRMPDIQPLDLTDGLTGTERQRGVYYISGSQGVEQQFDSGMMLWLNSSDSEVFAKNTNGKEGNFYRTITNHGLYQKDTNMTGGQDIKCANSTDIYTGSSITGQIFTSSCGDSRPKEFRFCSTVEYEKNIRGKVELCGIITNHKE